MTSIKYILLLFLISGILFSCGTGTVEVENKSYEPRIVIEGYLEANSNSMSVRLTRNFHLDTDLTKTNVLLNPDETEVFVTCLDDDKIYELTFTKKQSQDLLDYVWSYQAADFLVENNKTYKLDVSTTIDGKRLYASSQTTVPASGYRITDLNTDILPYRQYDEHGHLQQFEVSFDLSPDVHLYVAAIRALNPTVETFIYDNPYEDVEPEDVDVDDQRLNYEVIFNIDERPGKTTMGIEWDNFQFYDDYKVYIYAADQNYREFSASYGSVQELDGNFHEAVFNIDGDGIGVFGSIITDSVSCRVIK
jgi:hypothetical protein